MSGFLATTIDASQQRLQNAVRCLAFLGGDTADLWSDGHAVIALTRKHWETDPSFSDGAGILDQEQFVVAADASIYDRWSLRGALAAEGVRPVADTPAHLIAAAYRAWGSHLARHLNGDFAFVVWDKARRQLVAARDTSGLRPLFYTETPAGGGVASSARALAELTGRANSINLISLGAQVAGLPWSAGRETSYDGVEAVPAAHVITIYGDRARLERYWRPPLTPDREPLDAKDAAQMLRDLLATAVSDRLAPSRSTVWMSGGWDSTAVFASGQHRLAHDERERLRPVSISYPPNDPGREDELITAAADHWGANVQWLHSVDIPLLDALEQRAAETDEPPAHLYELWNRALARATRAAGSRIALDGSGGDQLFQVSDIVLADLLRAGHWLDTLRHARVRRRGWRELVRLGVLPLLPPDLVDTAERLSRSRVPRHYMERRVAPWMREDFVQRHALRERDIALLRSVSGDSLAHAESLLFLTLPIWGWGAAYMRGALLQEGVENRSPLLDVRVVEFALSRPTHERASAHDTKTLLRSAMQGLLPPVVLDRRPYRTGTTVGFSRRRMREAYPDLVGRMFAQPLRLAELGMVDPPRLRAAADRICAGEAGDFLRVNLFHAMKVEFWLRGFETRSDALHDASAFDPLLDSATNRRELRGPVARGF